VLEGNTHQILNQAMGVGIAWGLAIVGTLVILVLVDKTIGLRVSAADERKDWTCRNMGGRLRMGALIRAH